MTVETVERDEDALTLTVVAVFASPPDRVWRAWAEPRLLEQWWGPPGRPATYLRHELTAGADSWYFVTGPDGTHVHGWWTVVEARPPERLVFFDGFADDAGGPLDDGIGAVHTVVTFEAVPGGTRATTRVTFESRSQRQALEEQGALDAIAAGVDRIDALLDRLR